MHLAARAIVVSVKYDLKNARARDIAPHTKSLREVDNNPRREEINVQERERERERGFLAYKIKYPRAEVYVISSRAIAQLKGIVDRPRTRENG